MHGFKWITCSSCRLWVCFYWTGSKHRCKADSGENDTQLLQVILKILWVNFLVLMYPNMQDERRAPR